MKNLNENCIYKTQHGCVYIGVELRDFDEILGSNPVRIPLARSYFLLFNDKNQRRK